VQPRGKFLDLLRDEDLALVIASCRRIGDVGLLCIEPLRDIHSGEEDKSDSMRDVMRRLRVIGELLDGCTVAVAHHLNKSGESKRGGQRMRGSGAIHGSTDSGVYLSGLRNTGAEITNDVEVEVKGARGAGRFELTLQLVDGPDGTSERATWAVKRDADGATRASGVDEERLSEVMEGLTISKMRKEPCISGTQLLKELKGSKNSLKAALMVAEVRGYATKVMRGFKHIGWQITEAGESFERGETLPHRLSQPPDALGLSPAL
jgi:hypothetical protein